jgi:FkbM family methyltransferase
MKTKFYSQFGEDCLLAELFDGMDDGLCIEVGANDGVNDSTSYHFEQLGWECILVEANPDLCNQIRQIRRGRLFECAASGTRGKAVLNVAVGPGRAHGVSSLGAAEAARERNASFGFATRQIAVETRTLDDMLSESRVQRQPNFVSIDVEGHELDVLRGFSLERWKPMILIIEDNANFRDSSVRDYLRRFGYFPFRRTGVNDWYAQRSDRSVLTTRRRLQWLLAACGARLRGAARQLPGAARLVRKVRGAASK